MEKAIYGGSGLARAGEHEDVFAGMTVFTPLTLPGEFVEVRVVENKRSFLNAEVAEIVEPSLLRTKPVCPYFGACGGCSYQHAVYPHQLDIKTDILRETLERGRIADLPAIHVLSATPWHYRNRIRLHVQTAPFALGYRERRSHRLLPIAECPIAAPLLENAIVTVTDFGRAAKLTEFCDEIELFSNYSGTSLLISFFSKRPMQNAGSRLTKICEELRRQLPLLTGASIFFGEGKQLARVHANWGDASLLYPVAGFDYRVSLGSFFQVNRFLVDALADLVSTNRSGRLAWDLYAGVGLFARVLTPSFERIIAVESSPESAADLRHNLKGTSHRAVEAATVDFLKKQKASSTPPDLVVVDPPRAGLGPDITTLLGAIAPTQIVYVSCDPATLSRDLAALVQSGYDLQTITMVDMFPQTFHLESVSVLTRR